MTDKIIIDQSCEILQKTRDGEDLSPWHLKLVELAVNDFLSEKGKEHFQELYASVLAGYKKPWFWGIEHLTIDHTGYVYWKGKQVEHFSYPADKVEESKQEAMELAHRCRILEDQGKVPTTATAVWSWED